MAGRRVVPAIDRYWCREVEFLKLLKKMESRGVLIDQELCKRERAFGEARMWKLQDGFHGLKPSSSNDMLRLFAKAGIPLLEDHKTDKGNYSFDKEAMEDYDRLLEMRADSYSDMAKKILEYRGWFKTVTSNYTPYLNLVSSSGRIHCNFNQAGTKTGRLSCNDPNLQQIPRNSPKRWNGNLKSAFIAKPGFQLVACDYSQLEFRLSAAYAGEPGLLEIFNRSLDKDKYSKQDRDIFLQMCLDLGKGPEDRQDMKTLAYAKGFGAGKVKIATMLGDDVPQWVRDNYRKPDSNCSVERRGMYHAAWKYIENLESAKFYKSWDEKYPRVAAHSKKIKEIADERGYIRYWTGRRRHFEGRNEKKQTHKAYNSLIQGSGAEITKSAMLRLNREIDSENCRMLLQVHDSVVFEVREDLVEDYIPKIMECMSRVEEEFDFGVFFATEPEIWGAKE